MNDDTEAVACQQCGTDRAHAFHETVQQCNDWFERDAVERGTEKRVCEHPDEHHEFVPPFVEFGKIARLNRDITITEKIDGTNAAIGVDGAGNVWAQSRSRIITPKEDNFGFARWVYENALELSDALGPGLHFGEWWGSGIQRGYGLTEKRFSLFNTKRWHPMETGEELTSPLLSVVPILYKGPFSAVFIDIALEGLRSEGSVAAPGFDKPEGVVIFHSAARQMFKVTLEKDEAPKGGER